MQLHRLRGRKVCDHIRRKGNVWRGKTLTARWLPGPPPNADDDGIYLGTYASAKLHKSAVKRNRMRRRCREAFRTAVRDTENLPTTQLLIAPRRASLTCGFSDIQSDVASFLSHLSS